MYQQTDNPTMTLGIFVAMVVDKGDGKADERCPLALEMPQDK